jgi:hypothetical protein
MAPYFDGPQDDAGRDVRLNNQLVLIRNLMIDCAWRTLQAIADATGAPHASVSAQLRHLRKARFGSYLVERRHCGGGLYEYRVLPPVRVLIAQDAYEVPEDGRLF